MGFDQNDDRPVVNFQKWTTKVNIWMIVGALVFLVLGAGLIIHFRRSHANEQPIGPPPAISERSRIQSGEQVLPRVTARVPLAGLNHNSGDAWGSAPLERTRAS